MDPYAEALGFGGPAASAPPGDPYAAALGFSIKPKARKGGAEPVPGPGVDVAGAPLLAQSPATQAAVLADVKKTGAQNFTVNGAAPDATVAPVVVAPITPAAPTPVVAAAPRQGLGPWDDATNFIARQGANAGNSIYGGLKGLTTLATGGGIDAAAEDARSAPIPVVAPTRATAQLEGGIGAVLHPLEVAGDWAQRGTENTGVAGAGTMGAIAKAGMVNLPLLLGAGPRTARTTMEEQFAAKKAAAAAPAAPAAARAPGAAPTLADATPALQQAVAAAGPSANPAVVARHVEAETLPVPGRLTAGQAAQDPALISQEMNGRGKAQPTVPPEFYQAQGQALAANMDAIRATAAPDIPASASVVDHGQTLLDAYKAKDAAVTADISAKYKALADANGGSLPVNGQDFVASADAALAKQMKGRYVPKEVAADMEGFRAGGPMTFEDFENLRTNLAAEGRKAERAGDGNAAAAVNIVRNSLESLPITGETAAVKPLADAARQAARERFEAIRSDPAYKAAVNDPTELGQPSPAADRFFNSYVRDGARENVARMQAGLAENPAATQTIAAGTLDHLKAQLKADPVTGNFSQAAYNKALTTLGPKMQALVDPATAQQLQAVGGFAKNAQTQPRGSYVNNSNTAVELAAQGTKALAEHGTNMLFGGAPVGTVLRKAGGYVADKVGARNASVKSLEPGAGITRLSDLAK